MKLYLTLLLILSGFTLLAQVNISAVGNKKAGYVSNNALSCNNWLSTSVYPSGVTVGDVDITGNKLTVEAVFYRSSVFDPTFNFGKLVSKHTNATNVNYSLMPVTCEITTTNGYINTPSVCLPSLDKIYHVAMVYDGATLNFYRNGFLLSSVAWTGNLINNDLLTTIGNGSTFPFSSYQHFGYLNEVRIWNIARTQSEIRAYMNTALPGPTTIPGLVAYYTFDNLINKQGNAAWNGVISGTPSINSSIPDCNFFADSCAGRTNIGNIINTYTPVLALNPCANKITVEDASTFNTGDTVLMIQMKGAIIDSTNTSSFGIITDYKNAGNYEINYVKSKLGNQIELLNALTRQYDIPTGKVQLIRVPYYQNATITSTLTCLPWDGSKGGVLVLNAQDTVNLAATIDVSGKGFKGGKGFNTQIPVLNCFQNNYTYPQSSNDLAGQKGETIAAPSQNINYGKGSPASGGGGGLGHNSGGGGGSNGGTGGFGGYQLDACGNSPFDNRGIGGHLLTYNTSTNKIFAGGGGGAGQADNPGNIAPDGGNGGGIIIIIASKLKSNNNKIISNGDPGLVCSIPASQDCHDAMGGGGAGGSILLSVNQLVDNTVTENKGGKGADMIGSVLLGGRIGAGGGGSGGMLFIKSSSLPPTLTNTNTGGANGVLTQDANNSWGATPGQNGTTLFNLVVPIDNIFFKPNIDSVRISRRLVTCDSFNFNGLGYTNTNPVASWQWYFGDGGTATTQNTNHLYAPGSYTVKLIVTDINGCKDSISIDIIASTLLVDAGTDDIICSPNSTVLQGTSSNATQLTWTPAIYLNNTTILNPRATPPVTTWLYLTATNAAGCSRKDSVLVSVRSATGFAINPPADICSKKSIQLSASGGDLYSWQPTGTLDDPAIFNPTATPTATTVYSIFITDTVCHNTSTLSTTITVLPLPVIMAGKRNDIDCSTPQSLLSASGGVQYSWTPVSTLTNPNSANPLASPTITTQYIVVGTNNTGCTNLDSVIVKVSADNKGGYFMPSGFTPNNDGLNDCFGVKLWGTITEIDFSIFNRWGERIFHTTKIGDCWNGVYKGVIQTPDVYVYMIKAKTTCEPVVFRKGTFVLIR